MTTIARYLAVPAFLAVSTTLGACTGSTSSSGVEGNTVKIGLSVTLSGPLASSGSATECGVRAYLDAINANGGIEGYKFDITSKDNQYDPAVAAGVARDLASEGVFAVVTSGTATTQASVPVLKARGIPVLGSLDGGLVSPPKWEGEFGYFPSYEKDGSSAATFIREELKEDSASVVYFSPPGDPNSHGFETTFEDSGGTLAANEALAPDVTDFSALAQKLKKAGAPVVYAAVVDTQLAGLQKAADAIGYDPQWVSWTLAQGPTYQNLAGDLAEGVYFSQWATSETETDDPAVQDYLDAVGKVKGCEDRTAEALVKSGYAQGAMIAYAVEQIVSDGDDPTPAGLIDVLGKVTDQQFGLTPHVTFDDDSHAGVRQDSYWKVVDGQLELVRDFAPLPN